MRKLMTIMIILLALTLVLAACGGDSNGNTANSGASGDSGAVASSGGNAAEGEKLYKQTAIGSASAPGCVTCHSQEEGVVIVGPSHAGLASRAGAYVAGQSAEEYLRTSIVEPDAHIVDGFTPGVMYQSYGANLTQQQIDDLVAYLLTLN